MTAVANGTSTVVGTMNDFQGSLKVNVEIPQAGSLPAIDFTDPLLKLTSNLKGISMSGNDRLNINYTYATTRSPYFQLTKKINLYSLPKALKIVFNPHELPLNKIVLDLLPNNQSYAVIKEFSDIKANEDNEIYLPVSDIVTDPNDMAIWPLQFNSLKFTLNASGHSVGTEYTFELKEFTLIYDDQGVGLMPDEAGSNEMKIWNGTDGVYLYLAMDEGVPVIYEIYSIAGRKLRMGNLGICQTGEFKLNDGGLERGMYLLKVYKGTETAVFKCMKR